MKISFLSAAVCAFSTIFASQAIAGKKEDSFATCLWEVAPISSANWLNMPAPEKYQNPGSIKPEFALKQRLDAACFDRLVADGIKRPLAISIKKLRIALADSRPDELPDQEMDPRAFVCLRFFENDTAKTSPAAYRWGYGPDLSQSQLGEMSLVYATKGGGASLAKNGGVEKCQLIQSDGTLQDA